ALELVRDVDIPGATAAFAKLLPKVDATVQVALIGALTQRGDASVARAVASLASSSVPAVRAAAIGALGILGDASDIGLLAESAASANAEEQQAARRSLAQIRRGKLTESLLAGLRTAKPAVQAEMARALGERGDTSAIPKLLELARTGADSARKAAFQALALLVDQRDLAALVALVMGATEPNARAEAAETLHAACQHL